MSSNTTMVTGTSNAPTDGHQEEHYLNISSDHGNSAYITTTSIKSESKSPSSASAVTGKSALRKMNDPSNKQTYDVTRMRWALAEIAKTLQHIANMSCLASIDDMQVRVRI
jgi:hypothetical protein